MLDQRRLLLLARLYTLPIRSEAWLRPARPGFLELERNQSPRVPWVHPKSLGEEWARVMGEDRFSSIRQEQAEGLLQLVWNRRGSRSGQIIDLAAFYYELASVFLGLARDRLNLGPDCDRLPLSLTRLEALQLWHLIILELGPDLLPALFVAAQDQAVRSRLVAEGLPVDSAGMQPLVDLLGLGVPRGQGIADCHVHAGSALRAELVWPSFLGEIEHDPHVLLEEDRERPLETGQGRALATDTPLHMIAAVVRRVLGLVALRRWRAHADRIASVQERLYRHDFGGDGFLDSWEEQLWTGWLHSFQTLYLVAFLPELGEAELLVESRRVIDELRWGHDPEHQWPGFDALWWLYARIRARFHRYFIEDPGMEGLGYFDAIYQRSKVLADFRRRIQADPEELSRHLNPFGRMRHIELRVVPDVEVLEEALEVASIAAEHAHRCGRGATITLTVHSVKWGRIAKHDWVGHGFDQNALSLDEAMIRLREEVSNLEDYLKLIAPKGWAGYVVGFDVAGREMQRPNWFYLPAFLELRAWWRQEIGPRFAGGRDLGYTFHSGEDFLHLLQGLRHVAEIVTFFPWEEGDRIGHGLALGLDPEVWQRRAPLVSSQIDWILFDLVWEWGLYLYDGVEVEANFRARLEKEIEELGEQLLKHAPCRRCHDPLSAKEWHAVYKALFDPAAVLRARSHPVLWLHLKDRPRSLSESVEAALEAYLDLFESPGGVPVVPYPFRSGPEHEARERRRLAAVQDHLVGLLARKHVAVEACPLSNLTISGIPTLVDHPLLKLRERLPVLANTDNPLTFGTDLPLELRMIYEAELERTRNAEAAWRLIREIVENGNRFSFGSRP